MKKTITAGFSIMLIFAFAVMLFAADAKEILKPVYQNFSSIDNWDATMTVETVEKGKSKQVISKKIKYKKHGAKKENGETDNLYPNCIFHIEKFLENYSLTVLKKDERIKLGTEEIIAVPKNQKTAYPQIRIKVKSGQVIEMKFYSATGKKYYEVKLVGKIETSDNAKKIDIKETYFFKENTLENLIHYSRN